MAEIYKNTTLTVGHLINKIETGELGLPELQRPFVWKDTKVRDLFDSMMRGYPIGYLMLWECPDTDKNRTIGTGTHSYESPKEVIIDGQQRLTSLFAVMKGRKVLHSKYDERTNVISYCPLKNRFEVGTSAKGRNRVIKVGMRSLATSVKAQGVGSAYEEMIHLLAEYGKGEIEILRHGLTRSDVIHFHTLDPVSLLRMKLTRKPTIASVHFVPDTMKGSLRLPKPIQRLFDGYTLFFYRSAGYLHIVHPDTADILEKYGIDKKRIFFIPNVVSGKGFARKNPADRAEIRRRYGYRNSDFVVMGSGQLQTRKGIDTFAQVARKMPDTKFVWAGGFSFGALSDGYPELKSLLKNPPDNLVFTGIVTRQEVCDLLNAADLFFLPSYNEQFSMSILEAAATRTPVLLRNLPSYRTVYAERYLCGSTVNDFVSIIRELQGDRERLKHMTRLSGEISEMYSRQRTYEMWKAAYARCAGGVSEEASI